MINATPRCQVSECFLLDGSRCQSGSCHSAILLHCYIASPSRVCVPAHSAYLTWGCHVTQYQNNTLSRPSPSWNPALLFAMPSAREHHFLSPIHTFHPFCAFHQAVQHFNKSGQHNRPDLYVPLKPKRESSTAWVRPKKHYDI